MIARAAAFVTSLALAVWFGGLLALGAVAAPVVFSVVPFPANADAMSVVFRRFDLVAVTCGAVVVFVESARAVSCALARTPESWMGRLRLPSSVLALALACVEAGVISPRIAALHASGAVRGIGASGAELSWLHEVAEVCGKTELVLLLVVLALQVISSAAARPPSEPAGKPSIG
jgi:putative copper export protein